MDEIKSPKKLIEVALPLDDINTAAAKEKSIRQGHPSTLHLWWARRPLAAARAVLFAQLVNDPGYQRELGYGVNKKEAELKREELFQIIRDLVMWKNTNNEEVLGRAREAIRESWRETCHLNRNHPRAAELFDPEKLPAFHDPFAGGGAIPLEALRLGLESYASDLNPVAIMINKAMIEIPPKFRGRAPVGPVPAGEKQSKLVDDWAGAKGLAEDVRRYGRWMREAAVKSLQGAYPKYKISDDTVLNRPDLNPYLGQELNVIAWVWARTVKSPNPAFRHVDVPLASTFILSSKEGKEAWIEPVVSRDSYEFTVHISKPPGHAKTGTKASGRGANFTCLVSDSPIDAAYIRLQGKEGRIGQRLLAIVAEGTRGRVYLPPTTHHDEVARQAVPEWSPDVKFFEQALGFRVGNYGMSKWSDLFTTRQLTSLATLSDLIDKVKDQAALDATATGFKKDGISLAAGGCGATAYGEAVSVYLTCALGKTADYNSANCSWISGGQTMRNTFGRQAVPMVWDFAEANPLGESTGCFLSGVDQVARVIDLLPASTPGHVIQHDAATQEISAYKLVSTDPPYYDNIGYADLSDFFYVWARRSLRRIFPDVFSTITVPKSEELVATPFRHGGREQAEHFFMDGMTDAISNIANQSHPAFPVAIYYAFKQSDTDDSGTASTGWETFLEAVIRAGFSIDGTWPMRTEMGNRMRSSGSNALASSVVLVCRKRDTRSESLSRRDFQRQLREEMPEALETMIGSESGQNPIAPVDLAQAAIGPGMAIYSKYKAVLNQDGSRMGVHEALILINRAITTYLSPDSGAFDADTGFCSSWFEQHGWSAAIYGEAEVLSKAKGTTVDGVVEAGVLKSGGGKVRLLKWSEYESDWDPTTDNRLPIWEACHQMIRRLNQQGESAAGELLAKMPEKSEPIRQLAYHLYTLCDRKKWADDARAYNELITAWPAIVTASHETGHSDTQTELGLDI